MMRTLLLVCVGGAIGSGARYLISLALVSRPYATLLVNVMGSFAITLVIVLAARRSLSPELVTVITAGVLGGFTTYSAFNHELTMYLSSGQIARAGGYAALMIGLCLVAGMAALHVAR
jgi:CrcB protein